MSPARRQPAKEPAPVDPARTTSCSTRSSSHPTAPQEQPQRAPARSNQRNPLSRTTATVQDETEPEPGRGFAPLTELGRTVTPAAPPLQLLQPHMPPRAAQHNRQFPLGLGAIAGAWQRGSVVMVWFGKVLVLACQERSALPRV
ncbi:hypothetical protein DFH07DRAFT_766980 [Mycena maculata]|uniref:Uncharacterized protein n=1 Tax=Mycena maculata TaxID=230809 RepID=A0AAD7K2W7_9AGAR|nr:hypothetical protein DFH07DRAFT_766980 [Mycena maculata]